MACSCKKRNATKYLWYRDEGTDPIIYDSEIQAKAKVIRAGGHYTLYDSGVSIGTQVQRAEAKRVAGAR